MDSHKGTSAEYVNFCGIGKQFSEQLSAYVNERVDLKRTNSILTLITIFVPHLLIAVVWALLMLNVIPQGSVMLIFKFLGLYLLFEICAVIYILRKVNKAERQGIEYLRKAERESVSLLRELAKKDYPQEKPSLM